MRRALLCCGPLQFYIHVRGAIPVLPSWRVRGAVILVSRVQEHASDATPSSIAKKIKLAAHAETQTPDDELVDVIRADPTPPLIPLGLASSVRVLKLNVESTHAPISVSWKDLANCPLRLLSVSRAVRLLDWRSSSQITTLEKFTASLCYPITLQDMDCLPATLTSVSLHHCTPPFLQDSVLIELCKRQPLRSLVIHAAMDEKIRSSLSFTALQHLPTTLTRLVMNLKMANGHRRIDHNESSTDSDDDNVDVPMLGPTSIHLPSLELLAGRFTQEQLRCFLVPSLRILHTTTPMRYYSHDTIHHFAKSPITTMDHWLDANDYHLFPQLAVLSYMVRRRQQSLPLNFPVSLQRLMLKLGSLSDLSPLSTLTNLQELSLLCSDGEAAILRSSSLGILDSMSTLTSLKIGLYKSPTDDTDAHAVLVDLRHVRILQITGLERYSVRLQHCPAVTAMYLGGMQTCTMDEKCVPKLTTLHLLPRQVTRIDGFLPGVREVHIHMRDALSAEQSSQLHSACPNLELIYGRDLLWERPVSDV